MDEEKITIEQQTADSCAACGQCPKAGPEQGGTVIVADVHFREGGKDYYFDPGALTLRAGDHVILETSRGMEFGFVAMGNHKVSRRDVTAPLRKVIRKASPRDESIYAENQKKEKFAFSVCQQKIQERKLEMQLVSAECAFDGSKLLFFFTADGRVDFRELVKDLASVFHTRIELRQIGVRDKAKMVGGLGICGRPFCCREFLADFEPVSIKMAKTQSLSLNPTKISGTCGRLMCCLKYEQEAYEDLIKTAPKTESFVDTPDGRGTVCESNLLRQTVRVRMEKDPTSTGVFRNDEIYVIRSGKAKKTDPPIPEDFAPISSQKAPRRRLEPDTPLPEVRLAGENIAEPVSAAKAEGGGFIQRRRRRGGAEREKKQEVPPVKAEKQPPAAGEAQKPRRHRPHHRKSKNPTAGKES